MAGSIWDIMYQSPEYKLREEQNEISEEANKEKAREYNVTQQNYLQNIADQKAAAQTTGTAASTLVNEYNKAFADAKAEYANNYQSMLGLVSSTSGQRAADIATSSQKSSASTQQSLNKLGMGNTTVGSSLQAENERSKQSSLNSLQDTMNTEKLDIMKSKKTSSELAPDSSTLKALLTASTSNLGSYGVSAMAQALAAMSS